ncbi:MAG: OmpA family protein [Pseudomonadota bacterium]
MKGSARASQAVVSQLRQSPSLTAFGTSVRIEAEANHVRLELSDGEYLPLFDTGDGRLNARGEALVRAAALAIMALPYDLKLEGHTDANPSLTPGYSNWELSADRANAARRILLSSGIPEARLKGISGLAATRPLMQQSPHLPVNRRISIVLVIENNAAS